MKGLKKFFSPSRESNVDTVVEQTKEVLNGNEKIINNNEEAKEVCDDPIVKNMEEVLKTINKKMKKEKHKKKHHHKHHKKTKDTAVEESETNNKSNDKVLESNSVPENNKENMKKAPMTLNAFQVMMNARKQSIGSNLSGIENLEATSSTSTSPQSSQKRKRKEMLQEWADAKGGRARKEKEEAGEQYVKHELEKRATRLKNLLSNSGKKSEKKTKQEVDDIQENSDDVDYEPKPNKRRKVIKKRTKRQIIDDEDGSSRDSENFTTKLNSPIKKRDSLLGYFSKVNKNDESPPKELPPETTMKKSNRQKGRPKKVEEVESQTPAINEEHKHDTKPEEILDSTLETNDTGVNSRPRRSCTLAPRSYKFESPPKTKKKLENSKQSVEDNSIVLSSDECSREPPTPNIKLATIFLAKVPKPVVDPALVKARKDFLQSGLPETIRTEIVRQKEFEEYYNNEVPWFPSLSHVTQISEEMQMEPVDWSLSNIKIRPEDDSLSCNYSNFNLGIVSKSNQLTDPSKLELSWLHVKDRKAHGRKLKLIFDSFPTYKCFHQLHEKQKSAQEHMCSVQLFTDKYKPMSSAEFLINQSPVLSLKRFLSVWKDTTTKGDNYDDDFEESSRDSRSSISSSIASGSNVILIYGPSGSGKTSSVLALAEEMHFNVLEINAGAKRTGKKMLQELQEATQSHQLRKGEEKKGIVKKLKQNLQRSNSSQETTNHKMSLILIEDADVIFDQDDGFISGIQQLVAISKRPVILTAINPSVPHLATYLNQNSIEFCPPNPVSASKFLTVLCLAENYIVSDRDTRALYEKNNCDLRKTILQLQFYFQTGGDLKEPPVDKSLKTSEVNLDDAMIEVIPVSEEDLQEIDDESSKYSTVSIDDHEIGAPIEHKHKNFLKFFGHEENVERRDIMSGATLDDICARSEFISSSHTLELFNGEVPHKLTSDINEEILEMLSSDMHINKSLMSKDKTKLISPKLHESLPKCQVSQRANSVDYEPVLREICRIEKHRQSNDRKGSRFYHYLRNCNSTNFSQEYFDQFIGILKDS